MDRLRRAEFKVVVVTNQPDVGEGRVPREIVEEMNARLRGSMRLDAVKVCYHAKAQQCACRKPNPGMLLDAAAELGIDLAASVMVGDRASDIEAGARAGCRTALVDLGDAAETRSATPDKVVASLDEATDWILSSG